MNSSTNSHSSPPATSGLLEDLKRMPVLIILVLLFLIILFSWNRPILGYNMSGLGWVIPFAMSLIVLTRNFKQITLPYVIWLPWILLLLTYLILNDSSLLDPRVIPQQRTLQLLCPLAVGMALSTFRPTSDDLLAFFAICRRLTYLLLLIVLFKTGILLTGLLPSATGLAPEAITVTLLCTLYITSHNITKSKKDLTLWALLVAIPVIALTRTAILASLLTFPLSFAPLTISRRIVVLALIALIGFAVFNSERIQKKMFFSGKGTIQDISNSNLDFSTSGRKYMWEKMAVAADTEWWTGHGTGMGETFVYSLTKTSGYPHNDWLLTRYDYGVLGVFTYLFCCLMMVGNVLSKLRDRPDNITMILLLTGGAAFIPFFLMMFTDNILVYASFFGNLHYSILGLAYGALRARAEEASYQPVQANNSHYYP